MQLIEAYFDESGSDDNSEVLCVAGYLFAKEFCLRMDSEWSAVLSRFGLPYFRMSACAHGVKPFDLLSPDQRIEVEKELIALIKKHAAFGMAVTVEPKRFEAIMPVMPEVGSPYSFCAHTCLAGVQWWANKHSYCGDIAYFFESGHRSQAEANSIMQRIFNVPEIRLAHRYVSHTFADKQKVRPLQAADLLAWQWHTDYKRRKRGTKKEARRDLFALVEHERPPHHVLHFSEELLEWQKNKILKSVYPLTYPGLLEPLGGPKTGML